MSFPNDRTYSYDANLQFSDGGAYTATGFLQSGGVNGILDFGGNQGLTPKQQARVDACAVIDVTAIDISSGNETYKLMVIVSNDPALATGNVCAGMIELGKGASLDGLSMADSVIGRYEVMWSNNVAGSIYEFVGVYLVAAGTTPSITIEGFHAALPMI